MSTAGDVIDTVLDRLYESRTNPIFWSRTELLVFVNDGFVEFTLNAGQLISENTYTPVSSKFQAVPIGAIALIHVAYNDEYTQKSSLETFDRENPNWEAQSGILRRWAPCGLDKWILDRHPTNFTAVNLTTLDEPPNLLETSTIDLAPEYIEALADYVFHEARFKEGGAEFGQSMTQYDSFQNKAGIQERKTYAAQFILWSHDPAANTGEAYSN